MVSSKLDEAASLDDASDLFTTASSAGGESMVIDDSGRRQQSASTTKSKGSLLGIGSPSSPIFNLSPNSLQDRLFAKLLQQVLPVEDVSQEPQDDMSSRYANRPGFSLPLMTNNFRRFNSRIGVMFVFQARLVRLLTWQRASHTLSFLAVYTFVCLNPYLLPVLPLVAALFFVFVPAFLVRHPPPPATRVPWHAYSLRGPPFAPARVLKPTSELSKDFFRNMRDLQNSMDDFSRAHDVLRATLAPWTNFADERLSSAHFVLLAALASILTITAHLLPWRLVSILVGWTAIALGHPTLQRLTSTGPIFEQHIRPASYSARSWIDSWAVKDVVLDEAREFREVEVFELQRRSGPPRRGGQHVLISSGEWEPWIFSPSPWEPRTPARVAGERAKGTRFFEDIKSPPEWEWEGKKWELDLASREWVDERMVEEVEVEVDGERWVYDAMAEAEDADGGVGEWRRRRWIRTVRRRILGGPELQ